MTPRTKDALRPGMKPLLAMLSGIETSLVTDADWNCVLDLAEEQHVLPIAANALRRTHTTLLPEIDGRIETIEQQCAMAAFWWTSELKGLLQSFNIENIDTILLKGPSLAERIYGNIHLRTSSDIDLLVRSEQLQRARELLTTLSFVSAQHDNGHHEVWSRGTTALELHYDVAPSALFDFHIDSAWTDALPATFAGQPTLLFQPLDELLFLCIHGTRHCFDHMGHVLDIALYLEHLAQSNPTLPLKLAIRSEAQHLSGILLFGCVLAQRLRPAKLQTLEMPGAHREHIRMQVRSEAHWQKLMTEAPMPQTWASIRRFYRSTEVNYRGYLRSVLRDLRDGATLLIEADYAFAQRFGIDRDRVWMIYIARYVRLMTK